MNTFKEFTDTIQLDEKLITFAGKAYPTNGHVVILAGGAGSGKGFVFDKLIGIEGKVFDVDQLKGLALRSDRVVKAVLDKTGIDITKLTLTNPEDVSLLHQVVGSEMKLPQKAQTAFFADVLNKQPQDKPNIIFDVTLKDLQKLDTITMNVSRLGYEKKNIHIVWIVNDVEVAKVQNLNPKRGRVVDVDILINTHLGVSQTMRHILDMGSKLKKFMDGDIVFAFNKIFVDTELEVSKHGGSYLKEADYVYIKKSGKKAMKMSQFEDRILKKIAEYVPNAKFWI